MPFRNPFIWFDPLCVMFNPIQRHTTERHLKEDNIQVGRAITQYTISSIYLHDLSLQKRKNYGKSGRYCNVQIIWFGFFFK